MLQSHWNITGERRYVEFKESLKEGNKPAAFRRYAGIPASPPAEPDPPVYPEPPRSPEIPPDKEPRRIDDPPPDVVPVREPPATPGLVARWLAGSAAVITVSKVKAASSRKRKPEARRAIAEPTRLRSTSKLGIFWHGIPDLSRLGGKSISLIFHAVKQRSLHHSIKRAGQPQAFREGINT